MDWEHAATMYGTHNQDDVENDEEDFYGYEDTNGLTADADGGAPEEAVRSTLRGWLSPNEGTH